MGGRGRDCYGGRDCGEDAQVQAVHNERSLDGREKAHLNSARSKPTWLTRDGRNGRLHGKVARRFLECHKLGRVTYKALPEYSPLWQSNEYRQRIN